MQKIPSLFVRDFEREVIGNLSDGRVMTTTPYSKPGKGRFLATQQVTPGCEWVINGEGIATRKWDGTAIRINMGTIPAIQKRYDCKTGRTPPPDFEPCQDPDPITGHWPGWIPCDPQSREDGLIKEAYDNTFVDGRYPAKGTYELVGPNINRNKDGFSKHLLVKHGAEEIMYFPRTFDGILEYFSERADIEGIVFHHPDGRMCKVKRSDFGLPW